MNAPSRRTEVLSALLLAVGLAGCAGKGQPPPAMALDEPVAVAAQFLPQPTHAAEASVPPPMPGQMKPLPTAPIPKPVRESSDEKARVSRANAQARIAPTREGYVNAIQVWPYAEGALYQVYTSPGRVTAILLQPGEALGAVSAGDTVRWIVGDTSSGSGAGQRVNVLVKPVRTGLKTNLVITTNRRAYLLELTSTPQAWMASVSWQYPSDRLVALQKHAGEGQGGPSQVGLALEQLRFRYSIGGDRPPWTPLRAFDDGQRVYIQFPGGIAQGELPPLFVIGPEGDGQLVNYRYRAPYYVVDRLFAAAELRLGADKAQVVRIERTDGAQVGMDPAGRP